MFAPEALVQVLLTVLQAYPRVDTLKRHLISFHENKRLYKCDICQKSFKGHIRDHMRTHAVDADEKPYGCIQVCFENNV